MGAPPYRSILDKVANNLSRIRLLAALMVICAHSYAVTDGNKGEWIARLTGVTHAGELSVVVFFFISGALVTESLVAVHPLGRPALAPRARWVRAFATTAE